MSETHTKKYIDLYDLGIVKEYMAQAPVELTWAEWQALPNSKYTDGKQYLIKDLKIGGIEIDDTTPASDKVYSSSKVDTTYAKKTDLPVWTSGVTALTGATTATIQDTNITTNSAIEVFASVQGLAEPEKTITVGQCVLTFTALAQDTTFKLRVTN